MDDKSDKSDILDGTKNTVMERPSNVSGLGRRDTRHSIAPRSCTEQNLNVQEEKKVLVQGKINGRTMLRMSLDTGADRTVVRRGRITPAESISETTESFMPSQGPWYSLPAPRQSAIEWR